MKRETKSSPEWPRIEGVAEMGGVSMTKREQQILAMSAEGLTDKIIAQAIGISRDTVATYWRRLFAKMGVSSRTEAIAKISATALSAQHSRFESAERNRLLLECLSDPSLYCVSTRMEAVQAFEKLLQNMLRVVECEYGFISEVLYEDGLPFMRTHAMTDVSWSQETKKLYSQHLEKGLEFRNLKTLFGQVLVTREAKVFNDAPNAEGAHGVPKEHPPLREFLGIPLIVEGEMVGMIGLANKAGGFSQETIEFLGPVSSATSAILLSLRTQQRQGDAQRELAATESRLRHLLDRVTDGVMVIDPNRRLQYVNAAFGKIFREAIDTPAQVGVDCSIVCRHLSLHFQDSAGFIKQAQDVFARGVPHEDVLLLTDGRTLKRRFRPMEVDGKLEGYTWMYSLLEDGQKEA